MSDLQVHKRAAEATRVSSMSVEEIKRDRKRIDAGENVVSIRAPEKKFSVASSRFATFAMLMLP
jgi:hypothetical protein